MQIRILRTESFRLTALFTALFLGATLILAGSVYLIVDSAFKAELLHAADLDLEAIRNGYAAEGTNEAVEVVNQRLTKPPASDFLVIERVGGKKIAGNLSFVPPRVGTQRLPAPIAFHDEEEAEAHEILGRGALIAPGLYAFSGRDLYVLSVTETKALEAVAWVLLGTLLLAVGAGLILSRGFLRRMDAIVDTCRAIMAGRLTDRVPVAGSSDELARLAMTINAMLDRIGALMETINQISSDIAHDLRTPLTRLRQNLESARSESLPPDHLQAVDRAIVESENILSVFAALLRIGQIEAGVLRHPIGVVDLGAVVREICEIYRPAAEDSGHILEASGVQPAPIHGDRELLFQLFANLIENAIAHTPLGTQISIVQEMEPGASTVSISDTGPGIPGGERDKVFRRFYRLEQSRSSKGSGLGLALVKAIAQFHNATVTLKDNAPGLIVSLRFATIPADASA